MDGFMTVGQILHGSKYLFFTSYFLHPRPGDASLDWKLVTAGPHGLCLQGHTLSLLYTPPKPNLTSILA